MNCNVTFCSMSKNDMPECLKNTEDGLFYYIEDDINFNEKVSVETVNKLISKYNKFSLVKLALPFSGKNYLNENSQLFFGQSIVNNFSFKSSELTPHGPVYSNLYNFNLNESD